MTDALAIDLFCGVGGWTDGLLAEGWSCIGFDIERHQYGAHRYPADLVLQDVRTLHGSQFRDAGLIVASPPCQFFSYTAMPWTRARALAAEVKADPARLEKETALFNACFRLQREAIEAAGRHIPLVVENVRGAQPWVGRARWNFGSFYLWGDVPALMPPIGRYKSSGMNWSDRSKRGQDFTRIAGQCSKVPGFRFDGSGRSFQTASVEGVKGIPHRTAGHWTNPAENGVKHHGSGEVWFDTGPAALPSASPRRKEASALIAKIPLPLARHIGRVFRDISHV